MNVLLAVPDLKNKNASMLDQLNAAQKKAVLLDDRPVLVLAPAGTGKTMVLAARYLHLRAKGIKPNNILGLTFSRRAANEMRERIKPATDGFTDQDIYVDTFHGICNRILKTMAGDFGLRPGFRVAEEHEQQVMMREAVSKFDPDSLGTPIHANARIHRLLQMLEVIKTAGKTPSDLNSEGGAVLNGQLIDEGDITILEAYEHIMRLENRVDFADLILKPLRAFESRPETGLAWAKAFKAVMVDEFQDTNILQYRMLRMLCQNTPSVMLLGDDDQLIFSWRGASNTQILEFEKDWNGGEVMVLSENYRNAPDILARAKGLIRNNENRRKKVMVATKKNTSVIEHRDFDTQQEETDFIAREIRRQYEDNIPLDQIAVLTRTRARASELALALSAQKIPCYYPDNDILNSNEARSLISWARIFINPDDNLSIAEALKFPGVGLSEEQMDTLRAMLRKTDLSLYGLISEMVANGTASPTGPLANFHKRFENLRCINPDDTRVFRLISEASGLDELAASRDANASSRDSGIDLETVIDIFTNILEEHGNLPAVLEAININRQSATEAIQGVAKVRIDTMHSAKGLEYDVVIVPGWEEGQFPRNTSNPMELEEERRIAYVTMTRARSTFIASTARSRPRQNRLVPSRFLRELGMTADAQL